MTILLRVVLLYLLLLSRRNERSTIGASPTRHDPFRVAAAVMGHSPFGIGGLCLGTLCESTDAAHRRNCLAFGSKTKRFCPTAGSALRYPTARDMAHETWRF